MPLSKAVLASCVGAASTAPVKVSVNPSEATRAAKLLRIVMNNSGLRGCVLAHSAAFHIDHVGHPGQHPRNPELKSKPAYGRTGHESCRIESGGNAPVHRRSRKTTSMH